MSAEGRLLFVAMREVWQWSLATSLIVAGGFFVVDLSFLVANMSKVLEGGCSCYWRQRCMP